MCYLVVNHVEPVVDEVIVAFSYVAAVIVSEVVGVGISAEVGTRRGAPTHFDRLSAIEHQVGDGRVLSICVSYVLPGISVAHVVPVNNAVARNGRSRDGFLSAVVHGVGVGMSRNDGLCLIRVSVEVHYLSHSGCRTTCSGIVLSAVLLLVVFWAGDVVWASLVPSGGEEFAHAVLGAANLVALLDEGRARLYVVVNDELDLVGIELQPGTHVLGNIIRVERTLIYVAENRFHAVITGDYDVTAIVSSIEDIVVCILFTCLLCRGFSGSLVRFL